MNRFFKMLSLLPLWLVHALGWFLGWLAFLTSATYRRRFVANAVQAAVQLPDRLAAVGAAGMLLTELPRLWAGRPMAVRWEGDAYIDAALRSGAGILFLTPHLGCFEVTALAYAQRYGQSGPAMTVLYRPPRQAWLRALVGAARARPGLRTAETSLAGVRQMLRALQRGESVGLLPDQVPPQGQGVWADFFSKPAYTMTLSARLAHQPGVTVLLAWGRRLPWGQGYVVKVQPLSVSLDADVSRAAGQINACMERLIAQAPSQYLWGYARYKEPRELA
jgi:KDO2-lipid IV(A) lauroyltransferase